MDESGYEPPPAFAPPPLRGAPLNEAQVLGWTTYPPAAHPIVPPGWAPYTPVPVPSHSAVTSQPRDGARATRRHRHISVAVVVAVVASLVTIGVVLTSGTSHRSRSVSLPASVDEYTKLSTLSGSQLTRLFAGSANTFGSIPADDLATAKVALYSTASSSDPSLLFLGFAADESPTIGAQLHADSADEVASDVLDGAGSSGGPQSVDAGPLGGAIKCAGVDLDGQDAAAGVWADHDTLGVILLLEPGTTAARAGLVTRDFRSKAER